MNRLIAYASIVAAIAAVFLIAIQGSTPVAPAWGVTERDVTVGATAPVQLVPSGSQGFFIQPQTSGRVIRVGFGVSSAISGSQGVIVQYLEALAEQPRPDRTFHEVQAISEGGDVVVRVVYYQ